jgi:uncharacterized protein (TIGR00730 family)
MNSPGPQDVLQSQESLAPSHPASKEQMHEARMLADALVGSLAHLPDGDLVGRIISNAMKLLRDETNRGDIKLIDSSLAELRYALKVFAPYRDVRKISVFGSARTDPSAEDYVAAVEFGQKMAEKGWMVTTGAGGGIMAAAHGGAGADPSFGLAIRLPFEQKTNPYIANDPKLINFKYFFTRKLMFLRTSHAIALFPGGFGTQDEGFEALTLVQTGKSVPVPIVMLDKPGGEYWTQWEVYVKKQLLDRGLISPADLKLFKIANTIDEAVDEVCRFYHNFHSMRYAKDQCVFRLHRAPSAKQLDELNQAFKDILVEGQFTVGSALKVESDEVEIKHLPRLFFTFNRKDLGRMRELIDLLNQW